MEDEGALLPKVRCCTVPWFARHYKKLVLLAVIIGAAVYVTIDAVQKKCIETEQESTRAYRIRCAPDTAGIIANATKNNVTAPFLCKTKEDPDWQEKVVGEEKVCQRASSCVAKAVAGFLDWVQAHTVGGFFVFVALYIAATVLFVPGSLLTIGCGSTFGAALGLGSGVVVATVAVWLGAMIGCCLAMLCGRYLLKTWVAALSAKFKVLRAVDKAIESKGFVTVLLLRLSPVVPFNVFNYVMGATAVSFKHYAAASAVGMLPGTVAFVFIGAAVGHAAVADNPSDPASSSCASDDGDTVTKVLVIVGSILTVVAVVLISFYARKQLKRYTEGSELAGMGEGGAGEGDGAEEPGGQGAGGEASSSSSSRRLNDGDQGSERGEGGGGEGGAILRTYGSTSSTD